MAGSRCYISHGLVDLSPGTAFREFSHLKLKNDGRQEQRGARIEIFERAMQCSQTSEQELLRGGVFRQSPRSDEAPMNFWRSSLPERYSLGKVTVPHETSDPIPRFPSFSIYSFVNKPAFRLNTADSFSPGIFNRSICQTTSLIGEQSYKI